jgi:hypothetical protein
MRDNAVRAYRQTTTDGFRSIAEKKTSMAEDVQERGVQWFEREEMTAGTGCVTGSRVSGLAIRKRPPATSITAAIVSPSMARKRSLSSIDVFN